MTELWSTRARHLSPDRYRLDGQVARSVGDPSQTWGLGQAAIVLVGSVALFFGLIPLLFVVHLPVVLISPVFYAAEAGLVVMAARPAIRQAGSVSAALGFDSPRWRDSGLIAVWFLF